MHVCTHSHTNNQYDIICGGMRNHTYIHALMHTYSCIQQANTHARMRTCMFIWLHVGTPIHYVWVHAIIQTCSHVLIHANNHTDMHTCINSFVQHNTYTHPFIHTYAHIFMHNAIKDMQESVNAHIWLYGYIYCIFCYHLQSHIYMLSFTNIYLYTCMHSSVMWHTHSFIHTNEDAFKWRWVYGMIVACIVRCAAMCCYKQAYRHASINLCETTMRHLHS